MARAIWTGTLSFGLVNVPVGLFPAVTDRTVRFNQLQAGTGDRVRQKRVNERTGDEVDFADVVKGYDIGGGEYVIVTPEELEAVEPGPSRTIEISDFVDLGDIDPIFYKAAYYLAPQGEAADRAYALLRQAMEETGKVAIASMVLRTKQHLVAVRPTESVLALETMYYADEVRDPAKEIEGLPIDMTFDGRELDTAKLLIDSMTSTWNPENFHDTYRKLVEELIDRKREGGDVTELERREEPAPVVDLMQALQASVDEARMRRGTGSSSASAAKSSVSHSTKASGNRQGRPAATRGEGKALSGMSKSALLEMAASLDIPGRSRMNRAELEAAVAESSAESKGSRRRRAS
ncbi:MAG TPA: Ku protein [Acidimicrobiales bacterium]|nr:Ku protein [Acidimicrobiales bacterium]